MEGWVEGVKRGRNEGALPYYWIKETCVAFITLFKDIRPFPQLRMCHQLKYSIYLPVSLIYLDALVFVSDQ